MRGGLIALLGLVSLVPMAQAADCAPDVAAAFEKQRTSKAFRVSMSQPSAEGQVQMTVDYMPPDKMLQTVVSPAMPGEQQTMLVGDRAFAGTSGSFEELLPQFTQSIVAEVKTAVGAPAANLGPFDCLGKVTFEGKELLAYRTADKPPAGTDASKMLARTLYVDPASGLPAFNVVSTLSKTDEPVMKAVYSYPTDMDITAPANAPVQKSK